MTTTCQIQENEICFSGAPGMSIMSRSAYAVCSHADGKPIPASIELKHCTSQERELVDVHGTSRQLIIQAPTGDGLELTFRLNKYAERPFLLLRLSVRNLSREAIRLHELILLEAAPGQVQTDPPGQGLDFFKVGWHGWAYSGLRHFADEDQRLFFDRFSVLQYRNPTTPISHRQGEFSSEGWGILAGEKAALVTGFVSTADQFGQVYAQCLPGQGGLRLTAQAVAFCLSLANRLTQNGAMFRSSPCPRLTPPRNLSRRSPVICMPVNA
jgi:hypothetical protein